jgi:hypothetical protein
VTDWDAPVDKAPPADDETRPTPGKKDKRRWCRGRVGREHLPVVQLEKGMASLRRYALDPVRHRCRWTMWFVKGLAITGKLHWSCSHQWECATCGKIVGPVQPNECPEYVPGPTGPVDDLKCHCGHVLRDHEGRCTKCSRCRWYTWPGLPAVPATRRW